MLYEVITQIVFHPVDFESGSLRPDLEIEIAVESGGGDKVGVV